MQVSELERAVAAAELAARPLARAIERAEVALTEAVRVSELWTLQEKLAKLSTAVTATSAHATQLDYGSEQMTRDLIALRVLADLLPQVNAALAQKHALLGSTVALQPRVDELLAARAGAREELRAARFELRPLHVVEKQYARVPPSRHNLGLRRRHRTLHNLPPTPIH